MNTSLNFENGDNPTYFLVRGFIGANGQDLDTDEAVTAANAGDRLFIRCERQTLRRLPSTGWILFTIKTYVDPIASLATRPDAAAGLASAVRQLPEGTRRYKKIAPYQQALLDYLDGLAAD